MPLKAARFVAQFENVYEPDVPRFENAVSHPKIADEYPSPPPFSWPMPV